METWAESKGLSDAVLKPAVKFFTSAVVGRDPHEIGTHYFLDYIKSGGGFISIATEGEEGAQSLKIKQGKSVRPWIPSWPSHKCCPITHERPEYD